MQAFISPATLADRLAARDAITLLDVRDDADWTIEAPSATSLVDLARQLGAARLVAGAREPRPMPVER